MKQSQRLVLTLALLAVMALLPTLAFAQDPWTNIGFKFSSIFTGPLPRYLGIAAIGMGGISHMYAEHGMSQKWANVLIGLGAACFAAPTLAWAIGF
jgi:type IV secretory pathway VirB2 component (pilin)